MDTSFFADNQQERENMVRFVRSLSVEQLNQPMEAGWTVSAVLAHMAFWDQRALILIEKWGKEGIGPSPVDTDVMNEVTRPFLLAIPAQQAAEIFISSAEAVDSKIASLDPTFLEEIETTGKTVLLNRAKHRRTHMKDFEKVLGG